MPVVLLFDISGGEFLVVMLFVLMFFGAKGIPDMARTVGRFMRQVRDASQEVQREIHRGAQEVTRAAQEQRSQLQAMAEEPAPPPVKEDKPSA
jgi:sec-independent protein translocase protein TatA